MEKSSKERKKESLKFEILIKRLNFSNTSIIIFSIVLLQKKVLTFSILLMLVVCRAILLGLSKNIDALIPLVGFKTHSTILLKSSSYIVADNVTKG